MAQTTSLLEKDFEINQLRVLYMEPSISKFLMVERIVMAEPSNVREIMHLLAWIMDFLTIRYLDTNLL